MATAKKLPSGSWRVQVFTHTDADGRKHKKSFTAPTKREAEILAAQYRSQCTNVNEDRKTVRQAIDGYIKAKEGVLSPSTIRGYVRMIRRYDPIGRMKLSKFNNEQAQLFISDLSVRLSPKTVHNIWGLLISAVSMYCPDKRIKVTLPKIQKRNAVSPSDDDVQKVFRAASRKMKVCIALAAFGSLRRGEVAALKYGDIDGNVVHVHADYVKDVRGEWIYKTTKTPDSVRAVVVLPDEIIDLIGTGKRDDFIVSWTPDSITKRFIDLKKSVGVEGIRFHDLRMYFASIGVVLGIPDNYIADFGGWRHGSRVMKSVYQNKIVPASVLFAEKMKRHFSDVISEKSSQKVPTA